MSHLRQALRSMNLRPETDHIRPKIRRLWQSDRRKLVNHFQRLDPATRRLRFNGTVSDGYLKGYAERMLSPDAVVFGAFPDGTLRGVAELRGLLGSWPRHAEVALLVEPTWQGAGIGDALLNRLIAASRNRRIKTLHLLCLRENTPMRNLTLKHHAQLHLEDSDIEATLDPSWPSPLSVYEEMFGDTAGYLELLFHPQK